TIDNKYIIHELRRNNHITRIKTPLFNHFFHLYDNLAPVALYSRLSAESFTEIRLVANVNIPALISVCSPQKSNINLRKSVMQILFVIYLNQGNQIFTSSIIHFTSVQSWIHNRI